MKAKETERYRFASDGSVRMNDNKTDKMKAIKKAKNLMDKFTVFSYSVNDFKHITELEHHAAKQCALICVEELKNSDWFIPTLEDAIKWREHCEEVKQEINKL